LIEFDPKYKEEDLTSLYMGTNQFEKKVLHWFKNSMKQ
jgi:hypothetical protein